MRLFSCKLAATNPGFSLNPHRKREINYIIRPSGIGCTWKKPSPNLVQSKVEAWVLMIPLCARVWIRVRLQQRVTACLATSTVLPVLHVLGTLTFCGGGRTIGERFCFKVTGSRHTRVRSSAELWRFPDLANELQNWSFLRLRSRSPLLC